MTIASLGLAVDSSPAVRAAVDLDKLTTAAVSTETAVNKLGTSAPAALAKVAAGTGPITQKLREAANDAESFAARVNRALNVRTDFGGMGRGAEIEAYGRQLDGLRAKFNPLFATVQQYKVAQAEIRQAHSVGAISANEMTAALSRQRQAALASIDALKQRNAVISDTPMQRSVSSTFNTSNIAAQFQDIGVTAAMGMSPLQIALQQGTQLSAVFNDIKAKGQSIGPALVTSFSSIISPVSLITVGLIAAGVAAAQFAFEFLQGSDKTAEALEKEAALIQSVANKWNEALPALTAYANERQRIADQKDISDATTAAVDDRFSSAKEQVGGIASALEDAESQLRSFGQRSTDIQKIRDEFSTLDKAVRENKGATEEAIRIGVALSAHFNQTQIPALDDLAKRFFALAGAISVANSEATKLSAEALLQDASKNVLPTLGTLSPVLSAGGGFIDEAELQKRRADAAKSQYQIEQEKLERQPSRVSPGERAAQREANAYRDLIKSVDDRIGQMELEAQLIGKTGVEVDTLRLRLELLQKAEDKGRSASPAQIAEIEGKVAAYQKLAEATAKATLESDLRFEREQMFRSDIDQTIASTLKGAGLPIDFESVQAGLIRTNEQLKEARALAGDFASTFIQGIESGKSVFESLGDAALSVLDKITDKLLNDVLNALFEVNSAGSGSSGGIFGSILGALGLGGGGGMSSSYFPPAPSMGGGGLYANGDAFPNGVSGFRNTIVDTPTMFKFAKGTGIMGEAGPEAIMPLKRDSAGRLGVSAQAGSAANSNKPQEVTLRILNEEGPMFRTTIRAESEEVSVKVVQQNNENQKNYKQNGGE